MDVVTKAAGAENQFSDALSLRGDFSLSISGTFVGTVSVQRSFDGGSAWASVDTFTAPIETAGYEPVGAQYRVGIASGAYTSGTATCTLRENDTGR
jgi:hypothetical protein|tara:strand:- start:890 stop:1177 length:288 start_codon:yes stop_codon:yes gene_type:complete